MGKFMVKVKSGYKKVSTKVSTIVMAGCVAVGMTLGSFAAVTEDYVVIQSEQLTPLIDGAKANVAVIVPVGIGLLAISFGIGYALSTLRKFKKG